MYLPEFLAGIIVTLAFEFVCLAIFIITHAKGANSNERNENNKH